MNENLLPPVVRLLEGRGRWIRSGQENIVKYLSVRAKCGPNRLQELHDLLIASPEPLHVEHESGRITRVGLRKWLEDSEVETDLAIDMPKDLEQAYEEIVRLRSEIMDLEQLKIASTDADAALEIAEEWQANCNDLRAQLETVTSERDQLLRTLESVGTAEIASLQTQLANARSANESIRATFAEKSQALTDALGENGELKAELEELRAIKQFIASPEGKMLLEAFEFAARGRHEIAVLVR